MYLRVLGSMEAVDDGAEIDIAGGKERTLLAVLLVHAGRTVSTETLIDELWAVDPPATAAAGVHVFVSRLRRQLGPWGVDRLRRAAGGYLLDIGQEGLDSAVFEDQVAQGRRNLERGDLESARLRLDEADRMWRGPAFLGVRSEVVQAEATRLADLRVAARESRFDADLGLGRHGSVLADLAAATADSPLHERFWAQRILALYRCGRQADALAAYRSLRAVTRTELGSEPTPELQRLHLAVLRHDRELDWAPRSAPVALRTAQVQSLWESYERGRLTEVADTLDALHRAAGSSPSLEAARMLVAAERGDHATAWRQVDAFIADDFYAIGADVAWLSTLCLVGSAAAKVGHLEAARAVAERLEPYAGQFGLLWSGACSGPVDLHLGRIARALGDIGEALCWFERAAVLSRGLGMLPTLLTAEVELLETAPAPDDDDRIARLLTSARDLGMDRIAARLEAHRELVRTEPEVERVA